MRRMALGAVLLAFALAGCGGGSSSGSTEALGTEAKTPHRVSVPKAEAICASMVAEGIRVSAEVGRDQQLPSDPLTMTTRKLIAPAIPILEASARRLRALTRNPTGPEFEAYVSLFDPIVALLRDRVQAGEALERGRARTLEARLIELASLQRTLAREAGLKGCDVDYVQAFAAGGEAG